VPGWCANAAVAINGQAVPAASRPGAFLRVDRTWKPGDTVTLKLPLDIRLTTWEKNRNAVSVHRGPLTFSIKIGERWERCGGTDAWPELEVFPTTPWNYGVVLNAKKPEKSVKVVKWSGGPLPAQPFTPTTAPVELRVSAKKIPAWKQDSLGLVGKLQPSPVKSDQPVETITLIPMGAARLRLTAFPVIGQGPDAQEWKAEE